MKDAGRGGLRGAASTVHTTSFGHTDGLDAKCVYQQTEENGEAHDGEQVNPRETAAHRLAHHKDGVDARLRRGDKERGYSTESLLSRERYLE